MHRFIQLVLLAIICGAVPTWVSADTSLVDECEAILTIKGNSSIETKASRPVSDFIRFPSEPELESTTIAGPHLLGRMARFEILQPGGSRAYIEGWTLGPKDDNWTQYYVLENSTQKAVLLDEKHPNSEARRVEFLTSAGDPEEFLTLVLAHDIMHGIRVEDKVLSRRLLAQKLENKIDWYQRKSGRQVRTTLYARSDNISRLNYLFTQGPRQVRIAKSIVRSVFTRVQESAAVVEANRTRIKEIKARVGNHSLNAEGLDRLMTHLEERVRAAEAQLYDFGDYKAYFTFIDKILANEENQYTSTYVSAARALKQELEDEFMNRRLSTEARGVLKKPKIYSISEIEEIFHSSDDLTPLIAKLQKDLWAERLSFLRLLFEKVMMIETVRKIVFNAVDRLPAWFQQPFHLLIGQYRDNYARKFDVPVIRDLYLMSGDSVTKLDKLHLMSEENKAKLEALFQSLGENLPKFEDLREKMANAENSTLLINFSRLVNREYEEFWMEMKATAAKLSAEHPDPILKDRYTEFYKQMLDAEKKGESWGELSSYYPRPGVDTMATLIVLGGLASAGMYYEYGPQDTWLWQIIDWGTGFIPTPSDIMGLIDTAKGSL